MEIKYNVTGAQRKQLVQLISKIMECDIKYLGAPTFAYEVDYFIIDRHGIVSFDDRADSEEIENLIERLSEEGFTAESAEPDDETNVCISMPRSLFTDSTLENLHHLLKAKGTLIKKSLGVSKLPIHVDAGKVYFPWFDACRTPQELKAYEHFICKLCEMARTQKRVTAKEKEVDNERYAFRCFLLRLGFIGAEYKEERKILLRNLTGSSAFKNGHKKITDDTKWLQWNNLTDVEKEQARNSYVHLRAIEEETDEESIDPSGVKVCRFERMDDGCIYVDL